MTAPERVRPGTVTAVAVLCWILGTLEIVSGILALVLATVPDEADSALLSRALVYRIGYIVLGIAYIAIGFGIHRGMDLARVVVLLASLVNFGIGLFTALDGQLAAGIVSMSVSIAIVVPLWVGRGRAWFERTS